MLVARLQVHAPTGRPPCRCTASGSARPAGSRCCRSASSASRAGSGLVLMYAFTSSSSFLTSSSVGLERDLLAVAEAQRDASAPCRPARSGCASNSRPVAQDLIDRPACGSCWGRGRTSAMLFFQYSAERSYCWRFSKSRPSASSDVLGLGAVAVRRRVSWKSLMKLNSSGSLNRLMPLASRAMVSSSFSVRDGVRPALVLAGVVVIDRSAAGVRRRRRARPRNRGRKP